MERELWQSALSRPVLTLEELRGVVKGLSEIMENPGATSRHAKLVRERYLHLVEDSRGKPRPPEKISAFMERLTHPDAKAFAREHGGKTYESVLGAPSEKRRGLIFQAEGERLPAAVRQAEEEGLGHASGMAKLSYLQSRPDSARLGVLAHALGVLVNPSKINPRVTSTELPDVLKNFEHSLFRPPQDAPPEGVRMLLDLAHRRLERHIEERSR